MDFSIDRAMQQRLNAMSDFIQQRVQPLEALLLQQQWGALLGELEKLREAVRTNGWWAPHLPPSLGGCHASLVQLGLYSEVLGTSPLGHYAFGCQAPDAGNAELLHLHADEAQAEAFLKPLAAGQVRSCFAMTEPDNAGSNPTRLSTRAELHDGAWVINGRKWFTTAADGAAFAVVMAVTEDADTADRHHRASMLLVPCDTPGFRLLRNISVMGHPGHGPFSHAEVEFKDCRVPADHLLGERGAGFSMAQQRLGPGRIHHGMRWLGICRRALAETCQRMKSRRITDSQRLADQPLMQARLAEAQAAFQAARALLLETAWMIDNLGFKAARERVSMVKFFTAGVLQQVLDLAVQSHGALGVSDDTILAWFFREERAARIYDGPDEVHQLALARRLLAD